MEIIVFFSYSMDNVNLVGGLDPRKQELLEARFYGRVSTVEPDFNNYL